MFEGKLKLLKDRTFIRNFLAIAVPIIIQNFFSTCLNFVDGLMIGGIGSASAIAAVSLANKVFFLYSLVSFGLISGAGIFFAQYHGKKDYERFKRTMGITLILVTVVSLIFSIPAFFYPENIIRFFSSDPAVIEQGAQYLIYVAPSYILTGISFTLVFALRAINRTSQPMAVSITAVITNVILSYIFIYGKLGSTAMGVRGAALGTVIARLLEFILIIYFVFRKSSPISADFKELFHFRWEHVKHYLKISTPVILSESLWAIGIIGYTYAYAKLGTAAVASTEIGASVSDIFFVLAFGICHGGSIMVGNSLGAGDLEKAESYGFVFVVTALIMGIFTGLLLFALSPGILGLYKVDAVTKADASAILMINVFLMPIRFLNLLFLVGIFRGGGDTGFSLATEIIGLWVVGIPLTFILALIFHMPIEIVYMAHFIEELIKTIMCIPRYKKGKWLKRIIENE